MGFLKSKLLLWGIAALAGAALFGWALNKAYESGAAAEKVACQERFDQQQAEFDNAMKTAERNYANYYDAELQQERALWERQQKTEVRYETIKEKVIEYVENPERAQCDVDAEFMRIWNAANKNSDNAQAALGGSSIAF